MCRALDVVDSGALRPPLPDGGAERSILGIARQSSDKHVKVQEVQGDVTGGGLVPDASRVEAAPVLACSKDLLQHGSGPCGKRIGSLKVGEKLSECQAVLECGACTGGEGAVLAEVLDHLSSKDLE